MSTLKVLYDGVLYDDCSENEFTGEIFFAGNSHRYTPVDVSKHHLAPTYPKHLVAVDVKCSDGSYQTRFKTVRKPVQILRES